MRKRASPLAMVLCTVVLLSGCSVLGYGFGKDMEPRSYASDALLNVIPGFRVVIHDRDTGTAYTGRYLGLDTLSGREVSARYATALARGAGSELPAWGTEIEYKTVWGVRRRGSFHGFGVKPDKDARYVASAESYYVRLRTPDGRWVDVELSRLGNAADAEGHAYDRARWHDLIAERRIPVITALSLETIEGDILIPLDQVTRIEKPGKHAARYKGLLIGALIDVGMFVYGAATVEIGAAKFMSRF